MEGLPGRWDQECPHLHQGPHGPAGAVGRHGCGLDSPGGWGQCSELMGGELGVLEVRFSARVELSRWTVTVAYENRALTGLRSCPHAGLGRHSRPGGTVGFPGPGQAPPRGWTPGRTSTSLTGQGEPLEGGRSLASSGDVVPARDAAHNCFPLLAPALQQRQLSQLHDALSRRPGAPPLNWSPSMGGAHPPSGMAAPSGEAVGGGRRPVLFAQAPAHRVPSHLAAALCGPARDWDSGDLRHPRVSTFQTSAHRRPTCSLALASLQAPPGPPQDSLSLAKIRSPTPSLVSPRWGGFLKNTVFSK